MFVFIILHYLAEDMTKECVKYIQNHLDMNRIRIVIVDNASSNGSGARLKQFYKDNEYCDVILNDENMALQEEIMLDILMLKKNMIRIL